MTAVAFTPASRRSELITISTVGGAHFGSHVMQLALAPVLVLIRDDLGANYTTLAWVITTFYLSSGIGQVIAGFLVDRFGPHRLLIAGMLTQATGVLAMALVPSVWFLFPLAVVAGIGNSVYHPADMSILSGRVSRGLLGRAIATHVICGSAGFAAGPLIVGLTGVAFGWRAGILVSAAIGFTMAGLVIYNRRHLAVAPHVHHAAHPAASFRTMLVMPPLLLAFGFFVLGSITGGGINNFAVTALHESYGAEIVLATIITTAALAASALGTAVSGILIDRGRSHHRLGVLGLVASSALLMASAIASLPIAIIAVLLAGGCFFMGATLPARDLLVREVAPPGSLGRSFGVVYSGADFGQLVGPLMYGALLDHGQGPLVFLAAGLALFLALPTILGAWRGGEVRKPAPAE